MLEHPAQPHAPSSLAHAALEVVGQSIGTRRAALARRVRVAFRVLDDRDYLLDSGSPDILRPLHDDEAPSADVAVACNTVALIALLRGELGVGPASADQVFVCSGDRAVFALLADCLESTSSIVGLRASTANRKGNRHAPQSHRPSRPHQPRRRRPLPQ